MKKLLIYFKETVTSKPELLRSINVSADFVGIGHKGKLIFSEFKKLALDLEPTSNYLEII